MTAPRLAPALCRLRQLLARPDADGYSDAQLLQRFVGHRDEGAFELLVWRHGPMVLGVCRRLLGDAHDAEDAFQATLLALARKAGSIGKRESVGSWLYKVAYRVALRARAGARRRARHERQVDELPPVVDPHSPPDPAWGELRPVLDDELSRLPEKHRAPVVLCYLQGLTNEEAARRLHCPAGTVKTRLAHARRVLADRLLRRGLGLGAGLAAAGSLPPAGSAAVPAVLVGAAVRAAALTAAGNIVAGGVVSVQVAHLTEGVLRAMMVTKLKMAAVVVAAGLTLAGAGTASYRALAAEPAAEGQDTRPTGTPAKVKKAEARVEQIKERITRMQEELQRAQEEATRERFALEKKQPVAVIFGSVRITREELADHLIARLKPQELDNYLNRRILEHACREKGIRVTDAEVDAAIQKELAAGKISLGDFQNMVRQKGKTFAAYKDDVIRPRLLAEKLCRAPVSDEELRQAYKAKYGKRVECKFLYWRTDRKHDADCAYRALKRGEITFEEAARRSSHPQLAGRTVTIGASVPSGGDKAVWGNQALVEAARGLRPGEVSKPVEVDPQGIILLKCVRRIPPDTSTTFEDVRDSLRQEVQNRLTSQNMDVLMKTLRARARPRVLLKTAGEAKAAP